MTAKAMTPTMMPVFWGEVKVGVGIGDGVAVAVEVELEFMGR